MAKPKQKYRGLHVCCGYGCYTDKETVLEDFGITYAVSEAQAENNFRYRYRFKDYSVGDYAEEGSMFHYLKVVKEG